MNTSKPQGSSGFEGLLNVHINALEENSKEIEAMLQALSKKKLNESDKKSLDFVRKELKRLNAEIDNLEEEY